jgi:hypothetical protein
MTEKTLEAVAQTIAAKLSPGIPWERRSAFWKDQYMETAIAAIAAYRESVASEAVGKQYRYQLHDGTWTEWKEGYTALVINLPMEERDIFAAPPLPAGPKPVDAENEIYEIGVRDGHARAVQEIDELTGGDGEYRYCTDHDPDRHTPGPAEMIQRIVDRFETLNLLDDANKCGRDQDQPVQQPAVPEGAEDNFARQIWGYFKGDSAGSTASMKWFDNNKRLGGPAYIREIVRSAMLAAAQPLPVADIGPKPSGSYQVQHTGKPLGPLPSGGSSGKKPEVDAT